MMKDEKNEEFKCDRFSKLALLFTHHRGKTVH